MGVPLANKGRKGLGEGYGGKKLQGGGGGSARRGVERGWCLSGQNQRGGYRLGGDMNRYQCHQHAFLFAPFYSCT